MYVSINVFMSSGGGLLLKLLKYLKEFKAVAIISLLLVFIQNVFQLVLPWITRDMIKDGIEAGNLPFIYKTGGIMLAVSLVSVVVSIWNSYCTSKTSSGYAKVLRKIVFEKVSSLSQSDIDKFGVPSLITRSSGDIRNVQDMILNMLRMIFSLPLMLIGGLVMALSIDAKMTGTVLLVVAPLLIVTFLLLAKKIMPWFKTMQKKVDHLNQVMREKLGGIRVIRAFNRSEYENTRFAEANFELTSIALKIQRLFAYMMPVVVLLVFLLLIGLISNTGNRLQSYNPAVASDMDKIVGTIANMQAFITYLFMVIMSIAQVASMFVTIPKAQISAKRIQELLNTVPDIKECENPVLPLGDKKGVLEFREVTFGYPGAEHPVLNNISFTSHPGEVTAIIGCTGSGKSTLVSLIPRMYDISFGSILIDGVDIKDMSTQTLHSKISFIPQKAFLFSGTVADNLRYGKPDASEEDMYRALKIAQAEKFVSHMTDGIESHISQSATNISGGQKQRLSIARAIIKDAEICIFDDSFSALDLATDARLRAAIKENMKNVNTIIVAQRVGTVLDADRIIVLDEGKVVGMGRHEELVDTCETYREIVVSQLSAEEAEAI